MDDFSAQDTHAWESRLASAYSAIETSLLLLEKKLTQSLWLTGANFGLGDIAWIAHIQHIEDSGYDLSAYTAVREWAERMKSRPAYKKAVTNYTP